MQEITITAKIRLDEKHINAPSVDDCVSTVELALTTPDNAAYGIISIKVSGAEQIVLAQSEESKPGDLFLLEELFEELKPLVFKYTEKSTNAPQSVIAAAVFLNALMAAIIAAVQLGDESTLEKFALATAIILTSSSITEES